MSENVNMMTNEEIVFYNKIIYDNLTVLENLSK